MNETNVADGVKPFASGPMKVAPILDCLPWISKVFVLRPNGDAGNKNNGMPGANGRSVLKIESAESEPKIFSLLLPLSIDTVIPSSAGEAGVTFHDGNWLESFPASVGSDVCSPCTSIFGDDCVFA